MNLSRRAIAEFFGTFWLVFGGCGRAVLAAAFPQRRQIGREGRRTISLSHFTR